MTQSKDDLNLYIERNKKIAMEHFRFCARNSLYGINPNPPTIQELEKIGAFDKDNKESN